MSSRQMDLQACRITEYETSIEALPDRIENRAQWLKAQFDARTNHEVRRQHNLLVDHLQEYRVDRCIASEDIREMRLNDSGQLEAKQQGREWTIAGSGGHLMVTPDGRVLPMRPRLAFRGDVEMTDDAQAQATVVYGVRGEQGNAGVVVQLAPGMFALEVEADGHLYLCHNDNEPAPPLRIAENGHLVYDVTP